MNMTLFQILSCLPAPEDVHSAAAEVEDFSDEEYCGISLYPFMTVILAIVVEKSKQIGSRQHSSNQSYCFPELIS